MGPPLLPSLNKKYINSNDINNYRHYRQMFKYNLCNFSSCVYSCKIDIYSAKGFPCTFIPVICRDRTTRRLRAESIYAACLWYMSMVVIVMIPQS